jgi:hypothetical protein
MSSASRIATNSPRAARAAAVLAAASPPFSWRRRTIRRGTGERRVESSVEPSSQTTISSYGGLADGRGERLAIVAADWYAATIENEARPGGGAGDPRRGQDGSHADRPRTRPSARGGGAQPDRASTIRNAGDMQHRPRHPARPGRPPVDEVVVDPERLLTRAAESGGRTVLSTSSRARRRVRYRDGARHRGSCCSLLRRSSSYDLLQPDRGISTGDALPGLLLGGLVLWTFFANAVSLASLSLVANANLLTSLLPAARDPARGTFSACPTRRLLRRAADRDGLLRDRAGRLDRRRHPPVLLGSRPRSGLAWLAALNVEYRDIRYVVPSPCSSAARDADRLLGKAPRAPWTSCSD